MIETCPCGCGSCACHCASKDGATPAVERPTEPSDAMWPEALRLQVIGILREAAEWESSLTIVSTMDKIEAAVLQAGAPQEKGR